jgi:hypothetical protein
MRLKLKNRVFQSSYSSVALVEFDTHNRFKARAARGSAARCLEILDELDRR